MRAWYGIEFKKGSKGSGLARRHKIRFIYDYDTNSILVSNASAEQLDIVESLIEIYDRAPSDDSLSARRFQIFKLQYSQAEAVAKTIKEVYRDLLSTKDKEFAGKDEKQKSGQTTYYRIYGSSVPGGNKKPTKVKASFSGALSVGVDPISNTVIVSAQEEWLPSITEMIEFLDEQARPNTSIQVTKVSPRINSSSLQAALAKALGQPSQVGEGDAAKQKPDGKQPQEGEQNRGQGRVTVKAGGG